MFKIKEKANPVVGESRIEESKMVYNSDPSVNSLAICSFTISVVECDGSCAAAGYDHCDGYNCPTGECWYEEVHYFFCGTGNSGPVNQPNYLSGGPSISSGGGGVSEYEPNPVNAGCDGSLLCSSYYLYNQFKLTLPSELKDYLHNHSAVNLAMYSYLIKNLFSEESEHFVTWAINYLKEHPEIPLSRFENWFMTAPEGKEDNINVISLDDTNLTFPPQTLPSFDDILLAYPSHLDNSYLTPNQVYAAVGGNVLAKFNAGARNTCALRISIALNHCNISIPNIPGVTVKGGDDKYYFLVASNLLYWMKQTFGTPTGNNHLTGEKGGENGVNFTNLLAGKQGIYIMIPNIPLGCDTPTSLGNGFCASGHADLFYDNDCDGGCYFGARGGVKEIFFWNLP